MAMLFEDEPDQTPARVESGRLVLSDRLPERFAQWGRIDLSGNVDLVELPEGLRVAQLILRDCTGLTGLPKGLKVSILSLAGCTGITELSGGLTCTHLNLQRLLLRSLPADLWVAYRLDLTGCRQLGQLPTGLRVGLPGLRPRTPTGGSLILRDCTALEFLPDGLDVCYLDVRGCTRLRGWPDGATGRVEVLLARGCSRLTALPDWLHVSRLDITDCTSLRALPEGLRVRSEIEIANTAIRRLPDSVGAIRLRWRGVQIDEKIAFEPERITIGEILGETNAELRRVLLERFGLERFIAEANAEVLDVDHDAGGERKLLRVPMPEDEPLVCVLVHCPSTGRQYILRVPPTMQTCREAVAWTVGFDDPDQYRPLVET
jgi:hypothetical protein